MAALHSDDWERRNKCQYPKMKPARRCLQRDCNRTSQNRAFHTPNRTTQNTFKLTNQHAQQTPTTPTTKAASSLALSQKHAKSNQTLIQSKPTDQRNQNIRCAILQAQQTPTTPKARPSEAAKEQKLGKHAPRATCPKDVFPLISVLAYPFGTLTSQNWSNKAFGEFRPYHKLPAARNATRRSSDLNLENKTSNFSSPVSELSF